MCGSSGRVREKRAFDDIKEAMTTAPVLGHFDPGYVTLIQTDAAIFGWGFIISQINRKGEEHPTAMESGSFSAAEFNYMTTEKEFLAVVEACRKRPPLMQVSSSMITDHLNLTYWMEPRELNQHQARWVGLLSGFDFNTVYRPGTKAEYPDALSPNPNYSGGIDPDIDLVQALPKLNESSGVLSKVVGMLRAVVPDALRGSGDEQELGVQEGETEDDVDKEEADEEWDVDLRGVTEEMKALAVDDTGSPQSTESFQCCLL